MSTNHSNPQGQLADIARAVAAILGVPLVLFAITNNIVEKPFIALGAALITAVLASVWVVRSRRAGITGVIIAWLTLIVVVLAGIVVWPRTMTVEGTIRDTAGHPLGNEAIVLFDFSGRRYETETNGEGFFRFADVPVGKYKVQVRENGVEGEPKGVLIGVVEQNFTVPERVVAVSPTPTPTDTPAPVAINTPSPSPANTPTPTPHTWNVSDGDSVAQTITLIGEYPAASTDDLWVFVVPPNGLYYPQSPNACGGAHTPKVNGKWEIRIGLGGPDNFGESFSIVLTVANTQASQFVVNTLKEWCQRRSYPGLERQKLPQGITEMRSITVTRTADRWGPAPTVPSIQLPGQVSVTGIADGDTVPQSLKIVGTYTPEVTDDIWVFVYASDGRWYPQSTNACNGVHTQKVAGQWQVKAQFGGDQNVGEPFDIVVVLANAEANTFLNAKQQQWCKAGTYPGFLTIELPKGLAEQSRIRVYRR